VFVLTLWQCRGHGNRPFISLNTSEYFNFIPSSRTDHTCFSRLDLFSQAWGEPLPIVMFFQADHHVDHGSGHFLISSRGEIIFNFDFSVQCMIVPLRWLQFGMGVPQLLCTSIRLRVCVDVILLRKLNVRWTWTWGARSLPHSSLFFQVALGSTLGLHR